MRHLLVFRVTNNEGKRRNFEDSIVLSFRKRGIATEQVYQIDQYLTLREGGNLDKRSIDNLFKQTKADSILVIQRASVSKETVTSNFYGVEIAQEYETEYLAIKLLHLPSGRLLWSGTIRGTNTSYLTVAEMLIKSLGDAKLI